MGRPRKEKNGAWEERVLFGFRVRTVRERLSGALGIPTAMDYIEWLGLRPTTYYPWERKNAVPSLTDIAVDFLRARDKGGRPISECPRLLCWLGTGEDAHKPAWLDDLRLDPFAESSADDSPRDPSPSGVGATPSNVVQLDDSARELLGGRVAPALRKAAARELTGAERPDLDLVRTAADYETWLRSLPTLEPGATADLSSGSKCRLRSPVPAARPVQRIIKPDDTAVA